MLVNALMNSYVAPCYQCIVTVLQGTDLHEWEHQRRQAELTSALLQKEETLKVLRNGSRVTVGEVDIPEDEQLDKEVRLTQGF